MFTSKSFEKAQKKHELSCLISIFAVQLFETALTSVMFCISSSSAARDGGQDVRFTFLQDISPSDPFLQVNTPYIQYECLVLTKPSQGKIEISKSEL